MPDPIASKPRASIHDYEASETCHAALAEGHGDGGAEAEILAVSAESSATQGEVTGTLVHVAQSGAGGTVGIDAMSFRGSVGTRNLDGSEGLHVAATATAIGGEGTSHWTAGGHHVSVTGGVSAGLGAEASLGVRGGREGHGDEACVRIAGGPVTFGVCVESTMATGVLRTLASLVRY